MSFRDHPEGKTVVKSVERRASWQSKPSLMLKSDINVVDLSVDRVGIPVDRMVDGSGGT